jgi:hypothetical protein
MLYCTAFNLLSSLYQSTSGLYLASVQMNKQLSNLVSFSDFQDGASSSYKRGSFSLSILLKGDKDTLHREKSMNGVRQFVGLYKNFKLADDILTGASTRENAFKRSGVKQMNHARGTDGWFRSMFVLEVGNLGSRNWPKHLRGLIDLGPLFSRFGRLTTILIAG